MVTGTSEASETSGDVPVTTFRKRMCRRHFTWLKCYLVMSFSTDRLPLLFLELGDLDFNCYWGFGI